MAGDLTPGQPLVLRDSPSNSASARRPASPTRIGARALCTHVRRLETWNDYREREMLARLPARLDIELWGEEAW